MINSAMNYTVTQLWADSINVFYSVPRYQREYAWNKENWNGIFEDISEAPSAYFLGSIICINRNQDAIQSIEMELVDGQQRFVTLAILYCAIYKFYIKNKNQFDKDQTRDYEAIVSRLKLDKNKLRLNPSHQNYNDVDYRALLEESEIIESKITTSQKETKNYTKRKIYKAYDFFLKKLESVFYENERVSRDGLDSFLKKVNNVTMVKIEVKNSVDAYILFESLNNRGLPLTVMDLLKNLVYSKIEERSNDSVDKNLKFSEWENIIDNIGKENAKQERFFRSVYNAFNGDEIFKDQNEQEAKKSNLIQIYECAISNDAIKFLDRTKFLSLLYKDIIYPEESKLDDVIKKELVNLDRISGAPSYSLILYLLDKKTILNMKDIDLKEIFSAIVTFFVWRHATNKPELKDLVRVFMDIILKIKKEKMTGEKLKNFVVEQLKSKRAKEKDFEIALSGSMYEENRELTKYLLFSIEMNHATNERPDIWAKEDNGKDKWSIEHILPQGTLNEEWVKMLTNEKTDTDEAKNIRDNVLHKLGNLTITAYNSSLSNSSFYDKKNATHKKNNEYIGYRNNLYLNESVVDKNIWNEQEINKRTKLIVDEIVKLFK